MSDITKWVSRGIPSAYRSQNFVNADAVQGDIILVKDSLGRPARNVIIECEKGPTRVRFNVYQKVYQYRPDVDGLMNTSHLYNVASGVSYIDTTMAFVDVEAGSIFTIDKTLAVSDIQLVTVSGDFDIFVS